MDAAPNKIRLCRITWSYNLELGPVVIIRAADKGTSQERRLLQIDANQVLQEEAVERSDDAQGIASGDQGGAVHNSYVVLLQEEAVERSDDAQGITSGDQGGAVHNSYVVLQEEAVERSDDAQRIASGDQGGAVYNSYVDLQEEAVERSDKEQGR
jgi:hypothetical protein